jgi:lysophospholipase L1-like esterase
MANILCFGDSITYGAWDSQGGWVTRLRERIDRICIESDLEKFYLTYNLGISSDTSERLLERFDSELAARMLEEGQPRFVFSIGTNDSIWLVDEDKHCVELEEFKSNIHAIIEKSRKHTQ